ncbi:MAG: LysM peptidoglycan-binding domain-containing protein [Geodermatophilaceae bacterium]|nr:LysM peptidoglycan-binding domain-containing protein [Geodermatophilaceae bacterium]
MRGRGGALLRGLGSLVALLGILGGIPFGLVVFGGRYLPDHVPDWSEITGVLSRPDTGAVFFGFLTVVAWIGWAIFTLSVLVEIPAQLRRTPAMRLPGFGGGQRLAGVLVTGVIALLPLAPMNVGVATADLIVPAVSAPAQLPTAVTVAPVVTEQAPAASATGWSYAVQRGDTLWGLAERHLGDGELFTQIRDLNVGVPQADGRAMSPDGMIDIGWVLQISGQAPPDAAHQAGMHTVVAGDAARDRRTASRG